MSPTMDAREEILARIRAALPVKREEIEVQRRYARKGTLDRDARLQLLLDRLTDYGAEILEAAGGPQIAETVARALKNAGESKVIAPAEFPSAWLPAGFDVVRDEGLPVATVEGMEAVVTTSEAAIASTGTIVLVHGGAQGRRLLTLLPDHHICLVDRARVYELVPEALAAIATGKSEPITTISGPRRHRTSR